MNSSLIVLVSVALIALAGAICWRSFGKRSDRPAASDLRKDLEELKAQQKDFAEAGIRSNTEAYDRGRERLASLRTQIYSLNGKFHGEPESRPHKALAEVETLSARLEENVRNIRTVSASVAQRAQERLTRQIQRLKARVLLVLAEAKANDARAAALEQRLTEAEECLDEAMDLVRRASDDLASEPEYQSLMDNLSRASREVGLCLRAHAQSTVSKMDRMLAENDRLLRRLEAEETHVAEKST